MSTERSTEKAQPDVCPVCGVVKPLSCRNEAGLKIWPAHWQNATPPGQPHAAE